MCAYNFTTFLVKQLFEESQIRQRFPYLHNQWLGNNQDKANSILDIHLALIYRRKEDTAYLQYFVRNVEFLSISDFLNFRSIFQLKTLPIEAVLAAAEKCENRSKSSDWISALWSSQVNQKAGRSLVDFAMCAAARKKLHLQVVKKIVDVWLRSLNCDPKDSTLDIEVEKFVALDEHSALSYVIGHKLARKVRKNLVITHTDTNQLKVFINSKFLKFQIFKFKAILIQFFLIQIFKQNCEICITVLVCSCFY